MRITESRLRRIIKSVIVESWRKHSKDPAIRGELSTADDVDDVMVDDVMVDDGNRDAVEKRKVDMIKFFRDESYFWNRGQSCRDICWMAKGENPSGIRTESYPGWTNQDFKDLIREVSYHFLEKDEGDKRVDELLENFSRWEEGNHHKSKIYFYDYETY